MTDYPLMPLLSLRNLRQDKAMRALKAAEQNLAQARKELDAAHKAHTDFLAWLAHEEERRYQSIMGTMMSLEDIETFKQGLLAIRAKEVQFLEAILTARNQVEICEQGVRQAKADLLTAQKGVLKIEIHRDRWLEVARKEKERFEEREMEDFTVPKNNLFEPYITGLEEMPA